MVTILTYKHKWYYSLRWKLFFSYLCICFIPLIIFSNTATRSMMDYYILEKEKELLTTANVLSGSISKSGYLFDDALRVPFDAEIDEKAQETLTRILVLDSFGVVVNDSNVTEQDIGKTLLVPEVLEALEQKNVARYQKDKDVIYAAAAIVNEDSEKIGAVLVVGSMEDIFKPIAEIESKLLFFTGITVVIITFLVFFISKYLIDPLKNILAVVRKMSEGHLNQRIDIHNRDEFADLGYAFNKMAEELELVNKTREEFVSNVSHELKTPLSSIKVLSESILLQEDVPLEMYKEFLQDINSEIDRMTNIVNDLLNLVKLDQREMGLNIEPVDLNKLVTDILKRLFPLAEQKNIELLLEESKKITVDADGMKLSLAISNLVENGIKYTLPDGSVKVTVDSDHQNAFITVQDTGVGIAEEDQQKVFNRFYRVDKTRDRETGGTGLGLSITHSTVLLHNGSIRLTSKENEGSTFVIRIPIHYNNG